MADNKRNLNVLHDIMKQNFNAGRTDPVKPPTVDQIAGTDIPPHEVILVHYLSYGGNCWAKKEECVNLIEQFEEEIWNYQFRPVKWLNEQWEKHTEAHPNHEPPESDDLKLEDNRAFDEGFYDIPPDPEKWDTGMLRYHRVTHNRCFYCGAKS